MERAILLRAGKRKAVADLAIFELGKKWPQRLSEIHKEIVKNGGRQVTMQATHKSLKALAEQGIIKKAGRKYSLDRKWLERMAAFSEQAKKKYDRTIK